METTKLELAKNYCKDYKLKLNDFNDNGFFIASKKTYTNVYKNNFASKKEKINCENVEGFIILDSGDIVTAKNYGKFYNFVKFIFTYDTLNELKQIKNTL
jgi:hypothetical protein